MLVLKAWCKLIFPETLGNELQTTNPRDKRTYIDPNDYIDVQELLTSFTSELQRRDIKLDRVIGQGRCFTWINVRI